MKSYHNLEKTPDWQHKPCYRNYEPQFTGYARGLRFKIYRNGRGWQVRSHGMYTCFAKLEIVSKWLEALDKAYMPKNVGELFVARGTIGSTVYRVIAMPTENLPFCYLVEYRGTLSGGAWRWHHGPRHESYMDMDGRCEPASNYSAVSV